MSVCNSMHEGSFNKGAPGFEDAESKLTVGDLLCNYVSQIDIRTGNHSCNQTQCVLTSFLLR